MWPLSVALAFALVALAGVGLGLACARFADGVAEDAALRAHEASWRARGPRP